MWKKASANITQIARYLPKFQRDYKVWGCVGNEVVFHKGIVVTVKREGDTWKYRLIDHKGDDLGWHLQRDLRLFEEGRVIPSSEQRRESRYEADSADVSKVEDYSEADNTPAAKDFPAAGSPESRSLMSIDDNASVFSTTSMASSQSSVAGPAGVMEQLINLLIHDPELTELYQSALNHISLERFERNLSRILKTYASDLQVDATTAFQREASGFVRKRRRRIAHGIGSMLSFEKSSNETKEKDSDVPHDDGDEIYNNNNDDDEDEDEEEDSEPDLEIIRRFLVDGPAFDKLRENLRAFINPKKRNVGPRNLYLLVRAICSLFQYLPSRERIEFLSRPKVAPGSRRLTWTCVSSTIIP